MLIDVKNIFGMEVDAYVGDVEDAAAQMGNVVDLGAEYDAGVGTSISVNVIVTEEYADGVSQEFRVETGTTEAANDKVIATTGAVLIADLLEGWMNTMTLSSVNRYLRITRLSGAATEEGEEEEGLHESTAGAISAWISIE